MKLQIKSCCAVADHISKLHYKLPGVALLGSTRVALTRGLHLMCNGQFFCCNGLPVTILHYCNTVALAWLKQCLLSRGSHWPVALASFYVLFTLYCCIGLLQTGSGCSAGVLTYSLIPPPLLARFIILHHLASCFAFLTVLFCTSCRAHPEILGWSGS